jgi:hypothetical protein
LAEAKGVEIMSSRRTFLCLALVVASTLAGTSTYARAAAQTPALLTMLPGTWNCTFHGPKGTRTSTLTFSSANSSWLQDSSKVSAYGGNPAHEGVGLLGYDNKKDQYVGMGGNTLPGGDWGMGTAKASPTATTMTFVGAYPPDPTHETTAYTFTASSVTWHDAWTEKGKAMSGHGTCTKQ